MNNYVCVNSRFLFFDGKKRYTVEYMYGLATWYVFDGRKETDALFFKKINPKRSKTPTRDLAEEILYEYLETNQP